MKPSFGSFAYAQVRLAAGHSRRADAKGWRSLQSGHDLAHFLQLARTTGLAPWVEELNADRDAGSMEESLRRAFRAYVVLVADWVPEPWQAAFLCIGTLVETPALGEDHGGETRLPMDWLNQWRTKWPRMRRPHRDALEALISIFATHHRLMQDSDPEADGWVLRAQLAESLARSFRRHTEQPAAVLSHLGLIGIDLERLRGALLRRALFPAVRSDTLWV